MKTRPSTSALLWNVEGLNAVKSLPREDIFDSFDVVLLTETFLLRPAVHDGFYSFDSLAEQGGGAGRPSGGISILCKPHTNPKEVALCKNFVLVETNATVFCCFYFQPDTRMSLIVEKFADATSRADSDKHWLFAGDFNCRVDMGPRGEQLIETIRETLRLECLNDARPTYFCPNGSTAIDLVFTNRPLPQKCFASKTFDSRKLLFHNGNN